MDWWLQEEKTRPSSRKLPWVPIKRVLVGYTLNQVTTPPVPSSQTLPSSLMFQLDFLPPMRIYVSNLLPRLTMMPPNG